MTDLSAALAGALSEAQSPGDYYASGTLDMHPFRLEVDGIGQIALPLLPVQAEQLVAAAEQAPYGRGGETLVDTDVRRTWQVDAARVRIGGRRWEKDLGRIVRQAATGLGVAGRVAAEFYKLLIYDEGSFFVPHRDTEKAPGMFATLVVVLPSPYCGGELVIRHKGREARLDLRREEPSEMAYAAFYADCRHEVLPVASGCRLALVYNLIRPEGEPLPRPPDRDRVQDTLTRLLRGWQDRPHKLVYPLEHAYTEAELGFRTLKGADAGVAGALLEAAQATDCDLRLGLVTVYESGIAEITGGGYWGDGPAGFEIVEACEEGRLIQHWRLPDGGSTDIGDLFFEADETSPPDAFAGFEDIEPDFEEATGNEGASYKRLYRCAALVLWPRAHLPAVIASGGLAVSMPYLARLMDQWQRAGAEPNDDAWQQAHALALAIRDAWPTEDWVSRRASENGHSTALLGALGRLGDRDASAVFIAGHVAAGAYGQADNAALAEVLAGLPAAQAGDLLTAVVVGNARLQPVTCAALLARCATAPVVDAKTLRPPALALLAVLPGVQEQSGDLPPSLRWRREKPSPELVADTLTALGLIDPELATQTVAAFLADSDHYPIDAILAPAALMLTDRKQSLASGVGLCDAVLAHLERRIAEPLEPPPDWRRPSNLHCNCPNCRNLVRFLDSPSESVWHMKAGQHLREHVEQSIRRDDCDLDCTTDKRGRPYTLICTKNQASYKRRVRQREKDLADRQRLLECRPEAGGSSG
ncbi:MAG: 2OG-Fe(II) oxygenase [Candidatus Thiosymbion ectosymbiont of Robbea hypermnestra]|nr:2OG-Fe(II) oxygenase [Candidatus Thiosymbion ectosymbiont of Robbea hypermnestra]